MNMTVQELKLLFTSCSLEFLHLGQGQVPKYKDQYPLVQEITAECETNDRRLLLSGMRKVLKNHLRKIKNRTNQAYTYGGSFYSHDNKWFLTLSVAVALKD